MFYDSLLVRSHSKIVCSQNKFFNDSLLAHTLSETVCSQNKFLMIVTLVIIILM